MDSFLGFGVFKIAMQSEFLPAEMFQIFETLMYEETRHIVFFVNWMAYNEAQKGAFARLMQPLTDFRYYMRALGRMIGTAKRGKELNDGKEFSATQASVFLDGFTFRRFLEDCYSEKSPPHGHVRQGIAATPASCPSWPKPRWAPCACGAFAPSRCRREVGAQAWRCRRAAGRRHCRRLSGVEHRL